jgi:hypothetical protein
MDDGPNDDEVSIWGLAAGGCYMPLVTINLARFRAQGFGNQFMLRYCGHNDHSRDDPSGPCTSTPQDDKPVQPANSRTDGKPGLTSRRTTENVTVFFATGHSKV